MSNPHNLDLKLPVHLKKSAPQPSYTSKELPDELTLKVQASYFHAHPVEKIVQLIEQRESILKKKISEIYALPLPELEKNLAHYKLEDK